MKATFLPLLAATSLVAESHMDTHEKDKAPTFKQGQVLTKGTYPPAYNAPAQVKLQDKEGSWLPDLFIDGSFLYYHADEEGLDLATSAAISSNNIVNSVVSTGNSQTLVQDYAYKPGFQVGIGARMGEWTLSGRYTWIRQTVDTDSTAAPTPDISGAMGVWIPDNWFIQTTAQGQSIAGVNLSSQWKLTMDLANLMLSRAFYQGGRVSVTPSFGLMAAWIDQKLDVTTEVPTALITNQANSTITSYNSSNSWALGPKVSVGSKCLLGYGLRLEGDLSGSLLFTKYTSVDHSENVSATGASPSTLTATYSSGYTCVRPVTEMDLGIGWGSYFGDQKYHFDLLASYDFLLFWNQNMMRKLMDSTVSGTGASPGNLNLHGLQITARFDF